jgi:hypothetical protein
MKIMLQAYMITTPYLLLNKEAFSMTIKKIGNVWSFRFDTRIGIQTSKRKQLNRSGF